MAGSDSQAVPCVELRSGTKRFGELVAVDDLSLKIPDVRGVCNGGDGRCDWG